MLLENIPVMRRENTLTDMQLVPDAFAKDKSVARIHSRSCYQIQQASRVNQYAIVKI